MYVNFWLDTFMRQVTMQHNIYDRLLLLAAAKLYTCRYQELQLRSFYLISLY